MIARPEPTARELEVHRLIGEPGATYATVAGRLRISINTVKAHRKSLYRKLGVRNAVQAARALEATTRTG